MDGPEVFPRALRAALLMACFTAWGVAYPSCAYTRITPPGPVKGCAGRGQARRRKSWIAMPPQLQVAGESPLELRAADEKSLVMTGGRPNPLISSGATKEREAESVEGNFLRRTSSSALVPIILRTSARKGSKARTAIALPRGDSATLWTMDSPSRPAARRRSSRRAAPRPASSGSRAVARTSVRSWPRSKASSRQSTTSDSSVLSRTRSPMVCSTVVTGRPSAMVRASWGMKRRRNLRSGRRLCLRVGELNSQGSGGRSPIPCSHAAVVPETTTPFSSPSRSCAGRPGSVPSQAARRLSYWSEGVPTRRCTPWMIGSMCPAREALESSVPIMPCRLA